VVTDSTKGEKKLKRKKKSGGELVHSKREVKVKEATDSRPLCHWNAGKEKKLHY